MKKLPLIALLMLLMAACGRNTIDFPPKQVMQVTAGSSVVEEPAATIPAAQEAVANATAVPGPSTWQLGSVVLDWQRPVINQTLAAYWAAIYHPAGQPDCRAAASLIDSPDPNFVNVVLGYCDHWIEENWYVRALPLHLHEARYFVVTEPSGFKGIVVELDTRGPWQGEARYMSDSGVYGYTEEAHTIWRIYLRIVGDELKIYAAGREDLDPSGT